MIAVDLAVTLHAQLRSSRATAERARKLLAHTRARLARREHATARVEIRIGRPLGRLTYGNEPLDRSGLVAFTRCGHWWAYPEPTTAEQMHDVARFNLGVACSFCLADWHVATHAQARGMLTRRN